MLLILRRKLGEKQETERGGWENCYSNRITEKNRKNFTDMINNKNDELVKANLLRQVTNILSLTKSEAGKISKLKVF